MTTETACLEALREAAERLGESPTKAQYEKLDILPSAATILRVVGGWNAAKEQAGLDTNPSTGSRVQPKPDHVSIPTDVSWEALTQDQRWHYKNVEWNTHRSLRRRACLRRWLYEKKDDSQGCRRCDEDDPACLDFHHLDPDDKRMAVNKMVLYGYSRDQIRLELEQCVLLCANCHRREHATVSTEAIQSDEIDSDAEPLVDGEPAMRSEQRAWSRLYRAREGCQACGLTDPRCLAFHHGDPERKSREVSSMISDGYSFETVRREVTKCDVVCANCHRKAHYAEPAPDPGNDSV